MATRFAAFKQVSLSSTETPEPRETTPPHTATLLLPSFLGVRVKVPFTVRQCELSPPQTPHLSSTLLEPISLSQPTFCGRKSEKMNPREGAAAGGGSGPALGSSHPPRILHGHRCCRHLCRNSGSRRAPAASSKRRRRFLWTGSRGGTSCWLCGKGREVTA